jgi:hypothetical protein
MQYKPCWERKHCQEATVTDSTVAKTILGQISKGVLMSIGARDFVFTPDSLQMRVSNSTRRLVSIVLASNDLYEVYCKRMKTDFTWVTEFSVDCLYFDQLDMVLLDIEKEVWGR